MPIHHAVLALLAESPTYGYELKANFEDAIGPQWGELNIGHLYQVLDRLVRDGLATSKTVPQVDRPDRQVYRLTREGRRELDRWLDSPSIRATGFRDDFVLKLFASSRLGADRVRSVVARQRQQYLEELGSLGRLRSSHSGDELVTLLIEAAVLHTEANIRLAELAEQRARRIADSVAKSTVARGKTGQVSRKKRAAVS